jgi:FKBP-type peptidyl-prolyl cis-trans isomerase SlyD
MAVRGATKERVIMKIEDRTYVAIDYSLSLDSGEVVDKSEDGDPLGFIFGTGRVVPGLEKGLLGMEPGQSARITVEVAEGYGERKDEMFQRISRSEFPKDTELQEGMAFQAMGPHGPVRFQITEVKGDTVVADFNHPLAGERLHFDITVAEVRHPEPGELDAMAGGCAPSACGSCGGGCH